MVPSLLVIVIKMVGRRIAPILMDRILKVKVIFMLMAPIVKAVKVKEDLDTTTVKPMPTPRTTVGKSSAE